MDPSSFVVASRRAFVPRLVLLMPRRGNAMLIPDVGSLRFMEIANPPGEPYAYRYSQFKSSLFWIFWVHILRGDAVTWARIDGGTRASFRMNRWRVNPWMPRAMLLHFWDNFCWWVLQLTYFLIYDIIIICQLRVGCRIFGIVRL